MTDADRPVTELEDGIATWMDRIAMAASYYFQQLRGMGIPDDRDRADDRRLAPRPTRGGALR